MSGRRKRDRERERENSVRYRGELGLDVGLG